VLKAQRPPKAEIRSAAATTARYVGSDALDMGRCARYSVPAALIYPIAVPAIAFVLSVFLMPETRERGIWEEAATAQKA